jgi:hypothetical protein
VTGEPTAHVGTTDPDAADLEQALTMLAWRDPAVIENPAAVFAQLGVQVPAGLRVDLRIQRPDTLYLVIPPAFSDDGDDDGEHEEVVNQMDLWRSGEQFVWIIPQEAKLALLKMREQYRDHRAEDGQ